MSRLRSRIREEGGFTLMELSVALGTGLVVFMGLMTLIGTTTTSSARVANRVAVDQLARPAMQRIVNTLHSACVAPGIAPVLPGSDGSSISLIHQTGAAPSPVPDKRVIALSDDLENRYFLLWVTSLAQDSEDGQYRAVITDARLAE